MLQMPTRLWKEGDMNTFLSVWAIVGWSALIWFTSNATAHLKNYEKFATGSSYQSPLQEPEYRRYGVAPSTFNDETLLTIVLFLGTVVVSIAALSS
ncbi:MAG: hypothetical protein ACI9GB_002119 [Halioglobus sp.]|jgi:hypothetical protein